MLIWKHLKEGGALTKGERHKTIILLRLSTIAQPGPEGRGGAVSAGVRWGASSALYCEAANATK